jgi:uncharacterized protein (DUF924 family)/nitroreductase
MQKNATASHVIHPLLHTRWSPRAFADRPLEPTLVRSLLEAARWAPSCFNAQPWRFVVATRQDGASFERVLSCLNGSNQRWAGKAALLMVTVAKTDFDHNGKPNRHAWHDVGLAVAQMTAQATAEGLCVHQMAGIDAERTREVLGIPDGFEPVTAIAVGYPGAPEALTDDLRARELVPRSRLSQREIVFNGRWDVPLAFEQEADPERVLSFWFGESDGNGMSSDEYVGHWWKKDPGFDETIRERFGQEHAAIVRGERNGWLLSARGRLAYVIVLDQFSRNMFRGEAGMFAQDEQALRAALEGIELGMDRAVHGDLRAFYYLPLMHSENLAVQEHCVQLFETFVSELQGKARDRLANNLKFAIAHRDIVAKWGRFPHRNAILGRKSTPEEQAFLEQPGSSF